MIHQTRARWAFQLIFLAAVGLLVTYYGLFEGLVSGRVRCPATNAGESTAELVLEEWDSSRVLRGNLTSRFRDNLREDTWYITAWPNAGFTNQFMSFVNMIYLGLESDRVPIIPPFGPNVHTSSAAGTLSFGRVFNLSLAREIMRTPLLEWRDLKILPSEEIIKPGPPDKREQLGCWSTRSENSARPFRADAVVHHLRLDPSYTRIPSEARHKPQDRTDTWVNFHRIVPYIFPNRPYHPRNLPIMEASFLGKRISPEDHLSCFDLLYYATSSFQPFEWEYQWSPVWQRVGKYLHFGDEVVNVANGYLARAMQVTEDTIPPFIAVHVRRGDFATPCKNKGIPVDKCVPSLKFFKAKVDQIRQQLLDDKNCEVNAVVLMSDETDADFWQEVKEIGWSYLDHTKEATLKKHGEWYLAIIGQVVQSMATGFVGTQSSTYSLVAARRVEDWNNGISVLLPKKF